MSHVLLACYERDLKNLVTDIVRQALESQGKPAMVSWVDNVEEARDHLAHGSCDLLILDLHISASPTAVCVEEQEQGLNVLEWLGHIDDDTPSVLMLPNLSGRDVNRILATASQNRKPYFVFKGEGFQSDMKHAIDEWSGRPHREKPTVDIEIRISEAREARSYKIRGAYDAEGELFINGGTLRDLRKLCDELAHLRQWQKGLEHVSRQLMGELRSRDCEFWGDLRHALGKAGDDPTQTSVKFIVDPSFYEILLEALKYPRTKKYWMLQAPVYRAVPNTGSSIKPLFRGESQQRRRPINCLIINASTKGVGHVGQHEEFELDELPDASGECDDVANLLREDRADKAIGDVKVLGQNGSNFSETVRACLESTQWNIVHFIGHTYYDQEQHKGYVFLPGDGKEEIEEVEVEEFSQWLWQTNLVYLSSCDSARRGIAYELAHNQVPAVCGFRWGIRDDYAREYAVCFYSNLLSSRSIEKAFWLARKKVYEGHRREITWASPILIQQL